MKAETNQFKAPLGCSMPRCGYLTSMEGVDSCRHGIQMKDRCEWHQTPDQIREMNSSNDKPVRPPSRRRGL